MAGTPEPAGPAVDQGARGAQGATEPEVHVQSEEDVVESMRRQIAELEQRDKDRTATVEIERRAREAAENRARDAESRASTASRDAETARSTSERTVVDSQLDAVNSSIAAHGEQIKSLQAQYAAAFAEGDAEKVASVQTQIAKLSAEQVTLETGKAELETRKAGRTADASAGGQTREGAPPDPLVARENWIRAQPAFVQNWLRTPEGERYFTDERFRSQVGAAAGYAQNVKGMDIHSQNYIDFVREEVGLKQRQQADDPPPRTEANGSAAPPRGRDADAGNRMTTAPAGGATLGTPRPGTNEVYLTQAEREMARTLDVSESEYAKQKRALINEGLIGPNVRNR